MNLKISDLTDIKNVFEEAAISAGRVVLECKQSGFTVQNKGKWLSEAAQVVTDADLKSQRIILEYINPLLKKFDLGLLTEEEEDNGSRFNKDYFICVDPLDGTKSFVEHEYGFTISLSLVNSKGYGEIGTVYNPVTETLFSAIKNNGVYKNKTPFQYCRHLDNNLYIIADSGKENIFNKFENVITGGGAIYNAMEVLQGRADLYIKIPKKSDGCGSIWDFSSTSTILLEAGLKCSDYFGNRLQLNNSSSTFMNKSGVFISTGKIKIKEFISNLNVD